MASFSGASGTLIGSALETVGYYYQSWLLDALAAPFAGAGGALVYIFGAAIAIVSVAISGNFKLAPWLLIGPSLFFATTFTRTETLGSEWKFGKEERNMEQRNLEIEKTLFAAEGGTSMPPPPNVSSLFAMYNKLVSATTQEMVRIVNAGRKNNDKKFILRAELLAFIRSTEATDAPLRELIHHAFKRECHQALEYGEKINDPTIPDVKRKEHADTFIKLFEEKQIDLNDVALRYVATLRAQYPDLWDQVVTANPNQITEWMKQAVDIDVGLGGKPDPAFNTKVEESLSFLRTEKNNSFTCAEVWNYIFIGLHQHAYRALNKAENYGKSNGFAEDEILNSLLKSHGFNKDKLQENVNARQEKVEILYKAIAAYILRNENLKSNNASFMFEFAERGREVRHIKVAQESDLAFTERGRGDNREWQEKTRLMSHALQLPYYQGLVLYFLAVSYPFFALLLLIPGKHPGFLLWFLIWFWAKSWDVGFAIVMALDDVLFGLMAEGKAPSDGSSPNISLPADVNAAMASLEIIDPTFKLGTYYSIIAVALHAMPVVLAQLIFGSLRGGEGLIAEGMQKVAEPLANAAMQTRAHDSMMNDRMEAMNLKNAMAEDYLFNAKTGAGAPDADAAQRGERGNVQIDRSSARGSKGATETSTSQLNPSLQDGALPRGMISSPLDDRSDTAKRAAYARAVGRGVTDPYRTLDDLGFNTDGMRNSVARYAKAVGATANPGLEYLNKSRFALNQKDLDVHLQWSSFDAVNSNRAEFLMASSIVKGDMLAVPWTEGQAADQELELEVQKKKNTFDAVKALLETGEQALNAAEKINDARRPTAPPGGRTSAIQGNRSRRRNVLGGFELEETDEQLVAVQPGHAPVGGVGHPQDQLVANFGEVKTPEFGQAERANFGLGLRPDSAPNANRGEAVASSEVRLPRENPTTISAPGGAQKEPTENAIASNQMPLPRGLGPQGSAKVGEAEGPTNAPEQMPLQRGIGGASQAAPMLASNQGSEAKEVQPALPRGLGGSAPGVGVPTAQGGVEAEQVALQPALPRGLGGQGQGGSALSVGDPSEQYASNQPPPLPRGNGAVSGGEAPISFDTGSSLAQSEPPPLSRGNIFGGDSHREVPVQESAPRLEKEVTVERELMLAKGSVSSKEVEVTIPKLERGLPTKDDPVA